MAHQPKSSPVSPPSDTLKSSSWLRPGIPPFPAFSARKLSSRLFARPLAPSSSSKPISRRASYDGRHFHPDRSGLLRPRRRLHLVLRKDLRVLWKTSSLASLP